MSQRQKRYERGVATRAMAVTPFRSPRRRPVCCVSAKDMTKDQILACLALIPFLQIQIDA